MTILLREITSDALRLSTNLGCLLNSLSSSELVKFSSKDECLKYKFCSGSVFLGQMAEGKQSSTLYASKNVRVSFIIINGKVFSIISR